MSDGPHGGRHSAQLLLHEGGQRFEELVKLCLDSGQDTHVPLAAMATQQADQFAEHTVVKVGHHTRDSIVNLGQEVQDCRDVHFSLEQFLDQLTEGVDDGLGILERIADGALKVDLELIFNLLQHASNIALSVRSVAQFKQRHLSRLRQHVSGGGGDIFEQGDTGVLKSLEGGRSEVLGQVAQKVTERAEEAGLSRGHQEQSYDSEHLHFVGD
eukprot:GHVL01045113.1.p2 GENE.GHVL01045113.1~~GHVL01045113.1.p2  ORF type:complete len:213 (+),score=11.88 GHVL01045113.1:104-742(+)